MSGHCEKVKQPNHMQDTFETEDSEKPSEKEAAPSERADCETDTTASSEESATNSDNSASGDESERIKELEDAVEKLNLCIQQLEQKLLVESQSYQELENKLKNAVQQKEVAIKEKEASVMRYAVGEKAVLEQRSLREQAERKFREARRENEILQHKVTAAYNEKGRICQMLDNKCYELKTSQQELERAKNDLANIEMKVKWLQNNLKTEMELRKEGDSKVECLTNRLQEVTNQIEHIKKDASEQIRAFHHSQDNRAHVLDEQLKELQANLILERHEKDDRELQVSHLKGELEKLQTKHQLIIEENNKLSVKVQQLERERLETAQKLSELRCSSDKQQQDVAELNAKVAQIEQLKLQLSHEQEQREAASQQMSFLKQRNAEVEADMEACRDREAEMLLFTQQLTDKNVRLQSEFTTVELKVQQLSCEQTLLRRTAKEHETRASMLSKELDRERNQRLEETQLLARHLAEKTKLCEQLSQQVEDQKGENQVIRRKLDLANKEVTKELQQCRKKLEQYENTYTSTNSRSSSNSSLNTGEAAVSSPSPVRSQNQDSADGPDAVQIIQPEAVLDKQVLIEHIIKLQRASAKKSEKLDFLEEHVQTLLMELQRKSRLLQSYILREQTGALSSNLMDDNKAELAKLHGVMASLYGSRVADSNLTLELSLDINRKLQAILEETLLKNITLKESVDTLGAEIDRLNKLIKLA